MTSHENTPVYHAFQVKDGYWTKIGAAWKTRSGNGLSVALDLLPPDGRFILAEPKKRPAFKATTSGPAQR